MMFVAKNIRASRVNLLMNDYAAGLPSPLSFLGLADAIVRDLGLKPWSARVLPMLHLVTASEGRTKPEMENKSGVFTPIETMEDMVGTVEISLLLDIPGCDSEIQLAQSLMRRRIAGGIIQNRGVEVVRVAGDGSALRGVRRGYAMLAPDGSKPGLHALSNGSEGSYAQILDLLFPDQRDPGSGWLIPTAAGYRLLEDPTTTPPRIRRRDPSIPHVFAEPLLGVAELVSVRNPRLTSMEEGNFSSIFWSWCAEGDLVVGHSAYLTAAQQKEDIVHG